MAVRITAANVLHHSHVFTKVRLIHGNTCGTKKMIRKCREDNVFEIHVCQNAWPHVAEAHFLGVAFDSKPNANGHFGLEEANQMKGGRHGGRSKSGDHHIS